MSRILGFLALPFVLVACTEGPTQPIDAPPVAKECINPGGCGGEGGDGEDQNFRITAITVYGVSYNQAGFVRLNVAD